MPSRQRLYHPEQMAAAKPGKISRAYLFNPEQADIYVDVTEVYGTKLASSIAHKSQFPEGEKNLEWMRELDRRWAINWGLQDRYAEQFRTLRIW